MDIAALSIIKLIGDKQQAFLQGQITCDVNALEEKQPYPFAYCNVKGRVLASGWVWVEDGKHHLLIPDSLIESTISELARYALFSQVALEHIPFDQDISLPEFEHPFCLLTPETSGLFTPHMLSYQLIPNLISFTKGCFLGQEVIARTQHLGRVKRRLVRFSAVQPLTPAAEIVDQTGKAVGRVVCRRSNDLEADIYSGYAVIHESALKTGVLCSSHGVELSISG